MTPLQVMLLGARMRDAQKRWPQHPEKAVIEVMELERQFDEAIQPYMDYAKGMEEASRDQAPDHR